MIDIPVEDQVREYLEKLFPLAERGGDGKAASGGVYTERVIKNRLADRGQALVVRAAGSRGPFDLVAIVPDRFILGIQVKRGPGQKWLSPISPFAGFVPVLIRRIKGGWKVEVNRRPGDKKGTNNYKISDAQIPEILALAAEGLSDNEIAARYGCHRSTINKIKHNTYNNKEYNGKTVLELIVPSAGKRLQRGYARHRRVVGSGEYQRARLRSTT